MRGWKRRCFAWGVTMRNIAAVTGAAIVISIATAVCAATVKDKYGITAEEQSACKPDAVRLCSSAYPDEDQLLTCMKRNRYNLSDRCSPVFEDGIRKRHLD